MELTRSIAGACTLGEALAIARSTGWGAAEILQSYYHGHSSKALDVQNQTGGPVTAADLAANQFILHRLQAVLGTAGFGYLSEETFKAQDPVERLGREWVWVIDPLDGTRDFIDRTGEYAIHIALTHQGRPVLAVVVCPEAQKLYYATLGGGAFVEALDSDGSSQSKPVQVARRKQIEDLTLVVSRTHRDERFKQLLQRLPCRQQRAVGSVGCKIAILVEAQADVYISLSGKSAPKDWDMAAPELILTEAGGQFTRFDGTPLRYNRADVNQWGGILASNGQYHEVLCQQASEILAEIDAV